MVTSKKIIFSGLDNSGKTSIILSLSRKFSFMDSKPTIGLNRSELTQTKCLGMDLVAWDLGGQQKFRNNYFKQKYRVFANTTTMFYIIDMQELGRLSESKEYYLNIINTFEGLSETPKIILCLHKMDPDIRKIDQIKKNIPLVVDTFKKVTPPEFDFLTFETTIHDFATIINAYSEGVIKATEKAQLINDQLKEYSRRTFSSATLLMSEDLLMVGSHYSDEKYKEIAEMVAPRFIYAMDMVKNYDISPGLISINVTVDDSEEEATIFIISFNTIDNLKFNIIALTRNKKTLKLSSEYLPEFAQNISNLLEYIV